MPKKIGFLEAMAIEFIATKEEREAIMAKRKKSHSKHGHRHNSSSSRHKSSHHPDSHAGPSRGAEADIEFEGEEYEGDEAHYQGDQDEAGPSNYHQAPYGRSGESSRYPDIPEPPRSHRSHHSHHHHSSKSKGKEKEHKHKSSEDKGKEQSNSARNIFGHFLYPSQGRSESRTRYVPVPLPVPPSPPFNRHHHPSAADNLSYYHQPSQVTEWFDIQRPPPPGPGTPPGAPERIPDVYNMADYAMRRDYSPNTNPSRAPSSSDDGIVDEELCPDDSLSVRGLRTYYEDARRRQEYAQGAARVSRGGV
ncbi:hypothetical protein ACO1O0_005775 [Amphichorda felina]